MTMRSDLHEYVRDQLDVQVTRVRLSRRPMMPALSLLNVSGRTIPTHTGPAGLVTKRVQWDIWANNDAEVESITEDLRHLLDGFRGQMGDTEIGVIHYESEFDIDEEPATSEPDTYHRAVDFMVTYREGG